MDGLAWSLIVCYTPTQVLGRSMEQRGIRVTDTTKRRVSKHAMPNRRVALRWRDTYMSARPIRVPYSTSDPLSLLVLQPMGESRAICQAVNGLVCQDREENGRNATDVRFDVDRGSVHEESRG